MKENQELKLVELLSKNAHLSSSDLAMALNEDEKDVVQTVARLEKEGVLLGYHTLVNWDKTKTERVVAMIQVNVSPEREFGYDRIARSIYQYPEVDTMYLMSGTSEFIVMVHGRTMQEIAHFVGSKLACIPAVTGTSTSFLLKQYKVSGEIFDDLKTEEERLLVTP